MDGTEDSPKFIRFGVGYYINKLLRFKIVLFIYSRIEGSILNLMKNGNR